MNQSSSSPVAAGDDAPITNFSNCHVGILKKLHILGELPALLEPAARARKIAEEALEFFREAVFEHHSEEERDLFPAVIASAQPGNELEHVKAVTKRLTLEHRDIEARWKRMEPSLKKVAKGQDCTLDGEEVKRLVTDYAAHASFEEAEFLPLSQTILSRNSNHMAALGLTLHMRHAPPVNAYI